MKQPRLLIADSSLPFRAALAEALSPHFEIRLTGDGNEAWTLIHSFHPDILVLDILLPGLDGITLLRRCSSLSHRPVTLVVAQLYSDHITQSLMQLGVSYILPKPCQITAAADWVRELSTAAPSPTTAPQDPVNALFLGLGIPRKLHGCRYLRFAIRAYSQDPEQMLTKELYGTVAQQFHATASQVERSIRTAIHSAWLRRDDAAWQQFFPVGADGTVRRPTNGEFISRLSELTAGYYPE